MTKPKPFVPYYPTYTGMPLRGYRQPRRGFMLNGGLAFFAILMIGTCFICVV